MSGGVFRFGRFELDGAARSLTDDAELVHVEKQVFDVILYLIENRHRVVPKVELLDEVWGDRFVSESALTSRIKSARQAVGDDGRTQRVISTAHGVGYRFVAEVEATGIEDNTGASEALQIPAPRFAPLKAFVGRQHAVEAIEAMLAEKRMVTVVGPGGVGKTHLLRTLGDQLASGFEHIPILVRLAEVIDGDAIGDVLLDALGATHQPGTTATDGALQFIGSKRVLLLIDNAEHLRSDVADLARSILFRCPHVSLVVTSRQRLNVIGEHVFLLGPLAEADAVALFVEHAASHGHHLDAEREDVRSLCKRLDGVPLALELVAARTPMLAVLDLSRDLDQHLAAALDTEDSGRHSSVEAALGWSLTDLAKADRRLLSDLSCVVGPFDLAAAIALADDEGAAVRLLSLCERSLVVAEPNATGSRFRLLEPIRLFAGGSQDWMRAARRRHVAHYVSLAEAAGEQVRWSPAIDSAVEGLRIEWSNLRAAFDYADEFDDLVSMSRLVAALIDVAELRLVFEIERWAARIMERLKEPQPLSVELQDEVIAARARMAAHAGDLALSSHLAAQLSDSDVSVNVVMARIWEPYYTSRGDEAQVLLADLLERTANTGGFTELAVLTLELYRSASAGVNAIPIVERLIEAGTSGGPTAQVVAAVGRGSNVWQSSLDPAALDEFERAITLSSKLGHTMLTGSAASYRSIILASIQDRDKALRGLWEQLDYLSSVGLWSIVLSDLPMTVKVLADVHENELAAQLLGLRDASEYQVGASEMIAVMMAAVLDERLGQTKLAELMASGATLGLEDATHLAIQAIERHLDGGL